MNETKYNKLIKLLQYNEKESKLFAPNEIFNDLNILKSKGSSHIAFAYSYYYLICWLYRYAKYGYINIDVQMIKQVLGYNPKSKTVDYIIKKNGILDQLNYTLSTGNYPISWLYEDDYLEFDLIDDLDTEDKKLIHNKGRNYKIKYPIKCFYRSKESEEDDYQDGTFYDVSNTHLIEFDIFIECMENKSLGVTGFYLYGFIKMKCQIFGEYKYPIEKIASETGLSESTVDRYLGRLIESRLINYKENECSHYDGKFKKEPNSYWIK